MVSNDETQARGNRRGPAGYLCCKHCAEDDIHDVGLDAHDIACQMCDDRGAVLRERLAAAESRVARVEALISGWESNVEFTVHEIRAALDGDS